MNIPDLVAAAVKAHRFFDRSEIKAAKRKLSLPAVMRLAGDEAFISEHLISSPFHTSDQPTFRLYRHWRRVVFQCCKECGYEGDQIDYLKARYKLSTGQAIALFCRLAGIR